MAVKHILVVDDAETIRELLQSYLLESGYSVECAETAEEASKKLKARKPDLILLDVVLPDMLGTDLCVNIKQNKEYKFIPIIMCSANAISTQDKMKGLDTGADDYVTKPFVLEELNSRIRALLRRVDMDQAKHQIEEQAASQPAAVAAVETKVEVSPLSLLKYLGYSFVSPPEVFSNLTKVSKPWNLKWVIVFLVLVALFPSLPSMARGEMKGFFVSFFFQLISFALLLTLSAGAAFASLRFLFKKTVSFKLAVMILLVSLSPFLLFQLLSFLFVLVASYPAEANHFSAGIGLILPATQGISLKILAKIVDLFPFWCMGVAAVGLAMAAELNLKKALPIAIAAISFSLSVTAFLP
ncbi:MAG: response regulator [Elusimicrobia bacterium]|nr:response regulator [Elusimicrobiota bacterium]